MTRSAATPSELDELDRRIVAALQLDGRASWTAIAERCGTSIPTVARRAQQLLCEGIVRVAVVADLVNAGPADLFILKIHCDRASQTVVAQRLAQREDIRFLAIVTGGADIVAELSTPKADPLHVRLVDEVQAIDGVRRCETDLLLHTYKVAHDWSRQLLTGEDHVYAGDEPHRCDPTHFDETDRAMLALLRDDGRASSRALADALGVHESTARRRLETMLARGCAEVVTLVPAAALGFESEILFTITVAPARLDAVARELATYRGVRYVAATLGASSLMCEVILPTTHDIFGFVTTVLGELEGVQGWTAAMELLTFKRAFLATPWSQPQLVASPRTPAAPVDHG